MGKVGKLLIAIGVMVTLIAVTSVITCNKPVTNPAIERLETINDSLYYIIADNNHRTQLLYAKIDSLNSVTDTVIEKQSVINKVYRNEVYNIVHSTAVVADSQYRAVLQSSDSLYKQGFYNITYDIRSQAFKSQLP